MQGSEPSQGFKDMLAFGLIEALLGRCSRRVFLGAEIPDGVFAYKSGHDPVPLSELAKLLVVAACGSNTGWHHLIYRAERYAPYLPGAQRGIQGVRASPGPIHLRHLRKVSGNRSLYFPH